MEIRRRYSQQMLLFQSHILAGAFPSPTTFSIPSLFYPQLRSSAFPRVHDAMAFSARAWLKRNLMWFKFAQKERERLDDGNKLPRLIKPRFNPARTTIVPQETLRTTCPTNNRGGFPKLKLPPRGAMCLPTSRGCLALTGGSESQPNVCANVREGEAGEASRCEMLHVVKLTERKHVCNWNYQIAMYLFLLNFIRFRLVK